MDSHDQSQARGGAAAHTPGPWEIDRYGSLRGSNGREVSEYGSGVSLRLGGPDKEARANAQLRNAAPDLCEALKAAPIVSMYCKKDGFDDAGFFRDYETWSEMKRAAIFKALGQ